MYGKYGIIPVEFCSIDYELVEYLYRTRVSVDNDCKNIIMLGLRTTLSDGRGGFIDLSCIIFESPMPIRTKVNLKEDYANIAVHVHEPALLDAVVD